MFESLFSPSWYRVAALNPRLRSHVEIHRHHYRGELWYVLQDHASGRFQRFTPAAYLLIGLMDGKHSVQDLWEAGRARLGEDAPTQEEVIRLLSQLHAVNALQTDVLPDTAEMLKRFEKQRYGKWKQNLRSPLFMRFSLLDPERILAFFLPLVRPVFSWAGAVIWLIVVGYGIFLAGLHWPELTENITDRILAPGNLVILWLVFPFLKAFHEFGHAFAVKVWGGEVHEMGIMLLVFTPIPYVDASAASAFRNKRERVLVGAAGMVVEVFIAALALFLWTSIEPGPVRAVAFNIILIAGVSTLLFNGNPLLRYDAYYILADFLEIPNLAQRGIGYIGYMFQRYLLGAKDVEPPFSVPGERVWFVIYTIAAFFYRIFIFTSIILFIAGKFFFVGVLFACWGIFNMFVTPLGKIVRFLFTSPKLRRRRAWAVTASVLFLIGTVALVTFVPVPLGTRAQGVIWIPERAFVRAGTDGFVDRLTVAQGSRIDAGNPVIECSDPFLPAEIRVLEARMQELNALYDTQILSDRVQAEITREEIRQVEAELQDTRQRVEDLIIRSAARGKIVIPMAENLAGKFVRRGELLGYVLNRSAMIARVVVNQADVDFVRQKTLDVKVRFPEKISLKMPARLLREVPAATDQLPSRTLTQEGGGEIAIDPRDMQGIKAFQKVFLFDIVLPPPEGVYNVGGRVYVRFDHGREPLVYRWYRLMRQLFLRRFNV
jgi:putative peptide zinc metalloprotease protein